MSDVEVLPKETALAVIPSPEAPIKDPDDVIVVASNPTQMQAAQTNLIKHFGEKVAFLNSQLKEAEANLAVAKDRKWKVGPWQTQVKNFTQNIQFYEKVKAALEAGYVIVPNYEELDIFAIRTKKKRPKRNIARGGSTWVEKPDAQKSESPPLGEGDYVNSDTINTERSVPKKLGDGTETTQMISTAFAFDSVDFPFKIVKPQILEDTKKAMKVLCFDGIGVLPRRHIRRGDPMVIGAIQLHKKRVSFLITWWVDTSMI